MTQTNPKALIISLLKDLILVYDDSVVLIPGVVSGTWYDKRIIGDKKWMVTVGPTINTNLDPNDIGANTWRMKNIVVVNIWVPILEESDYSSERLRFSLKEEVKRLLKPKLVDPAADIRFLHLMNWRDIDDLVNSMLRIECTVDIEWNE